MTKQQQMTRDKGIANRAMHLGEPRAYYISCPCSKCKNYFSDLITEHQRADAKAKYLWSNVDGVGMQ